VSRVIDDETRRWTTDERPLPSADWLASFVGEAKRVRVLDCGIADGRLLGDVVLLDTSEPEKTTLIARGLAIREVEQRVHCMCHGWPSFEITHRDGRILFIGLHHGLSIRVVGWSSDAPLSDGPALLHALSALGVQRPLADFELALQASRQAADAYATWTAARPLSLIGASDEESPDDLWTRMMNASADEATAIRELLRWYGSGSGLYSGYPMYEKVPEDVLMRAPIAVLGDVIASSDLSSTERAGAARLVSSWAFKKSKPHRKLVTAWRKVQLLVSKGPRGNTPT
jgi:hypothetical protein